MIWMKRDTELASSMLEKPEFISVVAGPASGSKPENVIAYMVAMVSAHAYHMRERKIISDNEWLGWLQWIKNDFAQGTIRRDWIELKLWTMVRPKFQGLHRQRDNRIGQTIRRSPAKQFVTNRGYWQICRDGWVRETGLLAGDKTQGIHFENPFRGGSRRVRLDISSTKLRLRIAPRGVMPQAAYMISARRGTEATTVTDSCFMNIWKRTTLRAPCFNCIAARVSN